MLVDTNVILDFVTDDPSWANWSESRLEALREDTLLINPIIFSELCVGAKNADEVTQLCHELNLKMLELNTETLFLAAKVFLEYRNRAGSKTAPLPDFYIGAQAQDSKIPILTRDSGRYQTYFPIVKLITP